ncbi:hypothetical protein [Singulisphaera sp. PoT]|uniref:hypothetical protein n=1 Tax=Singulisphaera sp. PoT TaxID=3411797 RepID=UPI003BF54902
MAGYIVHVYREMRLTFEGIEAESPEAAALIARDRSTDAADDIADCDGEDLAALVDLVGDEHHEHSRVFDFGPEGLRKAGPALLAACRMVVERWERGDLAEAARACEDAIARAAGVSPPWEDESYSVLLLYPDYANETGADTYYAFVEAPGPVEAIALARRDAAAAKDGERIEPEDLAVLLVTQGHHPCELPPAQ